ncbi:hypothetical protein [Pseudomonas umsongensis]|uniref:hypothetical protein n=1 Tax=Pseudomonas umsongensis TaxID=198618 RepID=UPI00200AB7BC|nr:hypothetical protein [Pseudomonas umsongensis]MCK8686725.1 hypothetical protein [Pseudomonas umsongensis]
MNNNYVVQAKGLLSAIGVHRLSEGIWAFTDIHTADQTYIHHSQQPVALAAYAAVNSTFAAGRFPYWALVDMADKVPCMDGLSLRRWRWSAGFHSYVPQRITARKDFWARSMGHR